VFGVIVEFCAFLLTELYEYGVLEIWGSGVVNEFCVFGVVG
jgi:hypothetical protein